MERFETASLALMPGQKVQATVLSHHPWGVIVEIAGYENVGLSASIDLIQQFSRTTSSHDELLELFPAIGSQLEAVIEQIHRWHPPVSVRLSIRPDDLESLSWRCDFCGEPITVSPGSCSAAAARKASPATITVSPGGDALILDSRSTDGPGSHTIVSHRHCLADRIRPENRGERARALKIGKM